MGLEGLAVALLCGGCGSTFISVDADSLDAFGGGTGSGDAFPAADAGHGDATDAGAST
jgi:hypothetical protein